MNNVLYISSWSLGSANFLAEEFYCLPRLANQDLRFILITTEHPHFKLSGLQKAQRKKELEAKGIIWRPVNYYKNNFLSILVSIGTIFAAIYLVKKYKINTVFTRSSVPGIIGAVLKVLMRKLKFIHRDDASLYAEYVDSGYWKKESLVAKLLARLERLYIRNADLILVLTRKLQEKYKNSCLRLNRPVLLLPCCVDTNRFIFDAAKRKELRTKYALENRFVYIYAGKWGKSYCVYEMLEFFKEALALNSDSSIVILTPGDMNQFVQLLSKMEISANSIVSSATREEVRGWLSAADAGLSFLRPVNAAIARSPLKNAEYLSMGLPVVSTSNIGDDSDFIQQNRIGVVVKNFTTQGYQEACEELNSIIKSESEEALRFRIRNTAIKYRDIEGVEMKILKDVLLN